MHLVGFVIEINCMCSFSWYIKDIIAVISHFILCWCKLFSFAVRDVSEGSAEKDMRIESEKIT